MARGSGKTTKQLESAPRNSIFIWCDTNLYYPKSLARSLGRTDIEVASPYWLTAEKWRGRTLSGIIVDHAAELTPGQMYFLDIARLRVG